VNNAKVVTIIEEARILWLNHRAMDEGLSSFRVPKVVASLRVDYSASVTAEEDVTVSIWTERMGRTSFVLGYRGAQNGRQVFTASTVLVMLDPSTGSPRELTRAERDYLGRPLPART
jgi:acyl-CoA thioester hydrolase